MSFSCFLVFISGNNYHQVIITLGGECREWCDGRDTKIKGLSRLELMTQRICTVRPKFRMGFPARVKDKISAEQVVHSKQRLPI